MIREEDYMNVKEDVLWLRHAARQYLAGLSKLLEGIPNINATNNFESCIGVGDNEIPSVDEDLFEHYTFPNYHSPVLGSDLEEMFYHFAKFMDYALLRRGIDRIEFIFWRVPPETNYTIDFETFGVLHMIYCRFTIRRKP